jgi:hypothetical protein
LFSQKKNKTRFLLTYKTDQRATTRDGCVQRERKQTRTPKRKQTEPQTKSLTPYSNSNPKEFSRAEQQEANKAESSCCINVPSPNTSRDCSQNTHTHTPQNNNNNQKRRSSRRGQKIAENYFSNKTKPNQVQSKNK